jgi:thymidylate synthase
MVAHVSGLRAGELIHTFGDVHLYDNHREQALLQLTRTPRRLPRLVLAPQVKSLFDFTYADIQVLDYDPEPHIPAPVAV